MSLIHICVSLGHLGGVVLPALAHEAPRHAAPVLTRGIVDNEVKVLLEQSQFLLLPKLCKKLTLVLNFIRAALYKQTFRETKINMSVVVF